MLSAKTLRCSLASLIHSVFPFFLVTHTSTTIKELNDLFLARLRKKTGTLNSLMTKQNNYSNYQFNKTKINDRKYEPGNINSN